MPHAVAPTGLEDHTFIVNDGALRPDQVAKLKESSPDEPVDDLLRKYHEDGYVFLKGLLPREDVLKARANYFTKLAPTGVLKPGTQPVEGIFDDQKDAAGFPGFGAGQADRNGKPGGANAQKFVDLALEAHYEDWYKEDFCKHPTLRNFVARLTGWEDNTISIRRSLLRNNTPRNKAIGVHYDQIFMRHGEPTSMTAWVPMGDISLTGGGLIYLENGHTLGEEIEADFERKAEESGLSEEEKKHAFNRNMLSNAMLADGAAEFSRQFGRRWLVTNYEAGDVVLHTPFTIHASTTNQDPNNVIRLGTDLRFVDGSRPWDKRWDKDYEFNDGV